MPAPSCRLFPEQEKKQKEESSQGVRCSKNIHLFALILAFWNFFPDYACCGLHSLVSKSLILFRFSLPWSAKDYVSFQNFSWKYKCLCKFSSCSFQPHLNLIIMLLGKDTIFKFYACILRSYFLFIFFLLSCCYCRRKGRGSKGSWASRVIEWKWRTKNGA